MFVWSFMPIIRLFCNIATTILCSLCKKRPSTCLLHQGEHFCPCSFQYYYAKSQQICTTNSSSSWCTILVAVKELYIKRKNNHISSYKSTVQLLALHTHCIFEWRWLLQSGLTSLCVCCFAICNILNACNYLVAFYGGDLYSEGPTSKVTLWSIY